MNAPAEAEIAALRESLALFRLDCQLLDGRDFNRARHDAFDEALDSLAARLRDTTEALTRAAWVAQHLYAMIDRETWLSSGGDDGQGHYEGDYWAEQIVEEIKGWAALASPSPGAGEPE
jgi:hypothetical protein